MSSKISDLAIEVRDAYVPDKEDELPYIGLEHVGQGTLHISSIGSSQEVKSQKFRFKSGDILFGTLRPYFRKVIVVPCDGVCSTEFCVVRPKEPEDKYFVFYGMAHQQFIKYATTNSKGARPRTKWKLFSDFELPDFLPSQRRDIGKILSAYDDLIENNRRRIQLLEQAARLLYREWFVHLRFPGHEHVKIKDGVPEGWEKKTVLEVIEIKPKEAVPKGAPIRYVPMTCLSTTGMTVDLSDVEVRTKLTSVRYRNGDILFARITPCLENGKTGFVNFLREDEVACGSSEFIVLRGSSVSPYFAYCLARTHDFRETAIKSMIGSSGRQRVQPSCFDDFIVARPPRFLRNEFDRVCESIFGQIAGLSSQVQSLTKARDLLLPRLMNGEVTV